jgi:hypothetical protein
VPIYLIFSEAAKVPPLSVNCLSVCVLDKDKVRLLGFTTLHDSRRYTIILSYLSYLCLILSYLCLSAALCVLSGTLFSSVLPKKREKIQAWSVARSTSARDEARSRLRGRHDGRQGAHE